MEIQNESLFTTDEIGYLVGKHGQPYHVVDHANQYVLVFGPYKDGKNILVSSFHVSGAQSVPDSIGTAQISEVRCFFVCFPHDAFA